MSKREEQVGENDMQSEQYRLPLDTLAIVAECLAGDKWQGTLASLNVTSRAVQEYTSPILYETLILIMDEEYEDYGNVVPSDAWKYTRFLHVSEKLYQDHLRPLSERAAEQNPDFAEYDGTNPFPKILFPRLVTCMRRHEISPYEYDVHVSVHATIAPDSLLEMCSISDDYRRTKILGSVYRDHLSWMDDYSDAEYTPQDGDPEVITDTVRELRFSESGRIASIEEIRDSSHWVFPWDYDGDTGKGSSLLKLDFTNLTIEMEGNCLKQGARATDILFGVWFLMPEHNGDDYMFELVVSVPTWRVAGLTLYNYLRVPVWNARFLFETTKAYERGEVTYQSRKIATLLMSVWEEVAPKIPPVDLSLIQIHGDVIPDSYFVDPPPGLEIKFAVSIDRQNVLPEGDKGFRMSVEFYGKEVDDPAPGMIGADLWYCRTSPNPEIIRVGALRR